MLLDDPRHGTEAGFEQHRRDNEEACDGCKSGDIKASRRRGKRKAMGHVYLMPLGDIHDRLIALHAAGATYDDLTAWSGVTESQIWRALNGTRETVVYTRTWHRLDTMPIGRILSPIGVTRKIRALMWLGYSGDKIAEAAGCHVDTVRDARDNERHFLARKVKTGIADAYDHLSMTLPEGRTKQEKAGITRMRNLARRENWLPPLAWNNVDDPDEIPVVEHERADRRETILELNHFGAGISEVCRRTHLSRHTLQKWCGNHGLSDVYGQLVAREDGIREWRNQHTKGA